jgi:hypothetical protein
VTQGRGAASARVRRERWLILCVVLARQVDEDLREPSGRDLLVSATYTFAQLAAAIDRAFARWDLAHLHEFRLADGRRVPRVDEDEELDDEDVDEAHKQLGNLRAGETFEYVFDTGAGWSHDCTVLRDAVDPIQEVGVTPTEIAPIFGWGAVPDQYRRVTPDTNDG